MVRTRVFRDRQVRVSAVRTGLDVIKVRSNEDVLRGSLL